MVRLVASCEFTEPEIVELRGSAAVVPSVDGSVPQFWDWKRV